MTKLNWERMREVDSLRPVREAQEFKVPKSWHCSPSDRIRLVVPFAAHGTAKGLGAKWCPEGLYWYISPSHPRERFADWITPTPL